MKHRLLLFVALISVFLLAGCSNPLSEEDQIIHFQEIVSVIQTNFSFDGYEEIMEDRSNFLALPMTCEEVADAFDLSLQKLFVYKSKTENAVILLQLISVPDTSNIWTGSHSYSASLFNAPDAPYGSFYNENIPDIEVTSNSFIFNGCSFSVTCLCPSIDGLTAARILTDFSNHLIPCISSEEVIP